MTTSFRCPSCHTTFRVEDSSLGKTVICPNPGCNRKAVLPKAGGSKPSKRSRQQRDGKTVKPCVEKSPAASPEVAAQPQHRQLKSTTQISTETLLIVGVGGAAMILISVLGLVVLFRPNPVELDTNVVQTDKTVPPASVTDEMQQPVTAIDAVAQLAEPPANNEQPLLKETMPETTIETQSAATGKDTVQRDSMTVEEVAAQVESSIAFIEGRFGNGTGFLIRDGIVATNRHVIDEQLVEHLKIHFPSAPAGDEGPFSAELIYNDPDKDLAFLKVETLLAPLTTPEQHSFRRGQEVIVIGNPGLGDQVLQNAVSRGVISTEVTLDGQQYYQMGISINPGNSGGPVLDMAGEVVGVATGGWRGRAEGLAYCIPLPQLNEALSRLSQLSGQEIAIIQSQHRLGVVVHTVSITADEYDKGMQTYLGSMEAAINSGKSEASGLEKVRETVSKELSRMNRFFVDTELTQAASEVTNDPNIPERVRAQFADLWTNYKELKSNVENPRGTPEQFRSKSLQLSDKHDRLMHSLNLHLGVEDE